MDGGGCINGSLYISLNKFNIRLGKKKKLRRCCISQCTECKQVVLDLLLLLHDSFLVFETRGAELNHDLGFYKVVNGLQDPSVFLWSKDGLVKSFFESLSWQLHGISTDFSRDQGDISSSNTSHVILNQFGNGTYFFAWRGFQQFHECHES